MFWYLREYEDSPSKLLADLQAKDVSGELAEMPKAEVKKLYDHVAALMIDQGKNFYLPNEKAYRWFIEHAFIKLISGGNRSGKSATCAVDLVMQCEGWHPLQRENLEKLALGARRDWVRDHCARLLDERKWIVSPPVQARVVAVDYPNGVEKFTGPEIIKWASRGELGKVQYDNEKKRRIEWNNRSFCEFLTHDQDLDAHGGSARDLIYFDEEPPSDHYQENLMRVISTDGRIILGMTAVNGITWVYEELWEKFQKQEKAERGLRQGALLHQNANG